MLSLGFAFEQKFCLLLVGFSIQKNEKIVSFVSYTLLCEMSLNYSQRMRRNSLTNAARSEMRMT